MRLASVCGIAAAVLFTAGCARAPSTDAPAAPPQTMPSAGVIPAALTPQGHLPATADLLAEGAALYGRQCAPCHGAVGKGDGEAAYLLYPKPRDFSLANFRMVSTWEGKPTDDDLFYTLSRGMPGSAMPSWGHLSERQRWALVHHLKSLVKNRWETAPASEPAAPGDVGTGVLKLPPEPPDTPASRANGQKLFVKACAPCHGETARGDGAQEQRDDRGFPTRPRDLTMGVFKGDPSAEGVYRRILLGLPGSPMPASPWSYPSDAWDLVHFVRALSSEVQRERVEMKKLNLVAERVAELPQHPDSGIWRTAAPVNLHLMPLWWRSDRPEELTVRAVHDGRELALLLVWQDRTDDHTAMRPQDFRDAAAVEVAAAGDPPFFAMGEKGSFVDIWMWKSEKQADIDAQTSFQDLEAVYPRLGIDSYPNLAMGSVEQPGRHALTLASDPTWVTGWGAGNIVSDPKRTGAAEDLKAQGFGTLKARPRPDQKVFARGLRQSSTYRVFFRRTLAPTSPGAAAFRPGARLAVAFAVWDGSAGDRDGKKSVTIWHDLWLQE